MTSRIKKLEKTTSVVIFSSENKFDEYKFLIMKQLDKNQLSIDFL
jgi:hypothetical protein